MTIHKISLRNQTIPTIFLFVALAAVLFGSALTLVLVNLLTGHAGGPVSVENKTSFLTYRNPDFNYQISYPSDWKVLEKQNGVFTVASSATAPEVAQGGSQGLNLNLSKIDVIAYELDSNLSAQDFMLSQTSNTNGQASTIMVGGYKAVKMETQLAEALDNHTDNMIYTSVFVTVGNHGFIIAGFAPASQFNQILDSFHA